MRSGNSNVNMFAESGPVAPGSERPVSPGRRRFMRAQLLLGGGLAVWPAALLQAKPPEVQEAGSRLSKFFTVSQALLRPLPVNTPLDQRVAARLLVALNSEYPSFPRQLDLLPEDPGPDDRHSPVAQLIVAAWYLGTVGKTLVTFERALMYRLTADIFPVPSYCTGRPGDWASAPLPIADSRGSIAGSRGPVADSRGPKADSGGA